MMEKREKIFGVLEDDVQIFLKKIGILEKIESQQVTCASCGDIITNTNFGSVIQKKGTYFVYCEKNACLLAMCECNIG